MLIMAGESGLEGAVHKRRLMCCPANNAYADANVLRFLQSLLQAATGYIFVVPLETVLCSQSQFCGGGLTGSLPFPE
jgi:hypothetical protein